MLSHTGAEYVRWFGTIDQTRPRLVERAVVLLGWGTTNETSRNFAKTAREQPIAGRAISRDLAMGRERSGDLACATAAWSAMICANDCFPSSYPRPRRVAGTQNLSCGSGLKCPLKLDNFGAGDGIRTHDPNLGKVVLYP